MLVVKPRGHVHVGTSGWAYPSWRRHLYDGIPVKGWLAHAARTFGALEINGSFYTQIAPATYRRWRDETPDDFTFTLKGHRFVTHYKRLRDVDRSVDLLRDAACALGDKLAVVIWQLPSNLQVDLPRLEGFLASLARWSAVRHAIELRHASWFTDEVAATLRAARVAVCMGDAPDFPMWRAVTTDLVYARLHGHTRKYASSYHPAHLRRWAADIRRWAASGHDVHVYFDNDAEGAAVKNALSLRAELGLAAAAPPARTRRAAAR
jgi:uncharacterized protein YecE (DUF72 family)